jgi:tetratricopeptide (TPR) repeat protein
MTIPLSGSRRWQFVVSVVFCACVYLFLAGKDFVASVFAARPELSTLERAVRMSPGNADYRHRLGRYLEFVAGDPQSAIESLRSAVALDPHDAHYWFDLASAYQVTGDTSSQRVALDHALQAEPTAPDVAWEAANFFLIDGDVDRALREFRVVVANEDSLRDAALIASWRARPDTDALLRDVVPDRPDTLITFAELLMSKHETDGSIQVWERIAQSHQKVQRRYLYDYVKYLIEMRRPDAAMKVWTENADIQGLSAYLPTEDNLVVNGDFSLDILNGGFDWTYIDRVGVRPVLDPTDFRQGHRSLSITFEGPGINDAGIQQIIPVHPATAYDFSAYYKSAEFEGAGGPQIVLRDAYSGAPLYTSDPLTDADFWKAAHSKVITSDTTTLLVLNIERFPAGSPIRGKLWLGDFELAPEATPDNSLDKDKPRGNSDSTSKGLP